MFFIILSALLYALPFLFSDVVWWLVFIFPIPLLYSACKKNLSFFHGYVWGVIVFSLHLSGGICIVVRLAHESWLVGLLLGIGMVLYQALVPAILFWSTTKIVSFCSIQSPFIRVCLWTLALALFIFWTDQYCLWMFGITEGYPLMHPLILLTQHPQLLVLLPIIGKQLLTLLFLAVSVGFVVVLWYQTWNSVLFFVMVLFPWLCCVSMKIPEQACCVQYTSIKSLPCMVHVTGKDPTIMMKVVAKELREIIAHHPHTEIIVMPESSLNITDFEKKAELLQLWNAQCLGKAIHIIFGTCRWNDGNYYNSLHWVHNGLLQTCFDKKHAMLVTERLPHWMSMIRTIYFRDGLSITRSCNHRVQLHLAENLVFVPYICSELFFTEWPDDCYDHTPIIVIVNDMLVMNTYIQKLLLLLARFKAIQWQREIVYVSYQEAVCITTDGEVVEI